MNKHSQVGTFSQPNSINAFSNCLSHKSSASGCPYKFRSRRKTGSSMCFHDFGLLCFGRRIHTSGHSDFWICLTSFWASSTFTWVYADTASAACPSQSGYFSGRHLRCWWALFSKYCINSRVVFRNVSSKHNSSFLLLKFVAPTPNSLDDISPSMNQSGLCCCFSVPLLWPPFALDFTNFHAGNVSSFFHSLSTAAFASRIFIAWSMGINLCTKL